MNFVQFFLKEEKKCLTIFCCFDIYKQPQEVQVRSSIKKLNDKAWRKLKSIAFDGKSGEEVEMKPPKVKSRR